MLSQPVSPWLIAFSIASILALIAVGIKFVNKFKEKI